MKKIVKGKWKKVLSSVMAVVIMATSLNLSGLNAEAASPSDVYSGGYGITDITSRFQFFVKDNANNVGHTMGPIVVGGEFTSGGAGFADMAKEPSYIGNWKEGGIGGRNYDGYNNKTVYYGEKSDSIIDYSGNSFIQNSGYIDIAKAFAELENQSKYLSQFSESQVIEGALIDMRGVTNDMNYVTISADVVSSLKILVDNTTWFEDHALVISVVGVNGSNLTIGSGPTINNMSQINAIKDLVNQVPGATSEYLLDGFNLFWNFPDATNTLYIDEAMGHIIAPKAAVSSNSQYQGATIARAILRSGQGHFMPSTKTLPNGTLNLEKGSIVLYKQDEGGNGLKGAKIGLYKDSNCTQIVTYRISDDDGKVEFNDIDTGVYFIKEIAAPDGYVISNKVFENIAVIKDTTTTIEEPIVNEKMVTKGGLWGTKYGSIAGVKFPLANAKFGVYSNSNFDGDPIATAISGKDGKFYFYNLEQGTYFVKELEAPDGYELSTTNAQWLQVNAGQMTQIWTEFVNDKKPDPTPTPTPSTTPDVTPVKGKITVLKYGSDDMSKLLSGAIMQIMSDDVDMSEIALANSQLEVTGNVGRWTTGTRFVINELPEGSYTISEISVPDNYEMAGALQFSVNNKGELVSTDARLKNGVATIVDNRKTTPDPTPTQTPEPTPSVEDIKLKINKQDEGENSLNGATMSLKGDVGNIVSVSGPIIIDRSETEIRWVSAQEPIELKGFKTGKYTIEEIAAPDGYALAKAVVFSVESDASIKKVSDDENSIDIANKTITIVDKGIKTYTITMSKTGSDLSGSELSGAVIELTSTNGATLGGITKVSGPLIWEKTPDKISWTSADTALVMKGILPGEYKMHEVSAPDKYSISKDVYFKVDTDGKISLIGSVGTVDGNKVQMTDTKIPTATIKLSKRETGKTVELAKAKVTLSSLDANLSNVIRVSGPDFLSKSSNAITWETSTSVMEIEGLLPGNYSFTEITPPNGYKMAKVTKFVIDANGALKAGDNIDTGDKTVLMYDDPIPTASIQIAKKDDNGSSLSGAKLTLISTDADLTKVEYISGPKINKSTNAITFESSSSANLVLQKLQPGTYTLKETQAPTGYKVAADIKFKVKTDGTIESDDSNVDTATNPVTITMTDENGSDTPPVEPEKISISFSKVSVDGTGTSELTGAVLKLTVLSDGKNLEKIKRVSGPNLDEATYSLIQWKTNGQPLVLEGFEKNSQYKLEEIEAPKGYKTSTAIIFTVDANGDITGDSSNPANSEVENAPDKLVRMVDELDEVTPTTVEVKFSKQDANGSGSEIEGARIRLTAIGDGDKIIPCLDTVKKVSGPGFQYKSEKEIIWVSAKDNPMVLTGFVPGEYVMEELAAPHGYTVATNIYFKVGSDGTISESRTTASKAVNNAEKLVVMFDDAIPTAKVKFSKKKDTVDGDELAKATIKLSYVDGNYDMLDVTRESGPAISSRGEKYITWISADAPIVLDKLLPGKYVMHEEVAPDGYLKASDIEFVVAADGTIDKSASDWDTSDTDNILRMVDKLTTTPTATVQISKIALKLAGPEIAGAELELSEDYSDTSSVVFDDSSITVVSTSGGTNVVKSANSIKWTSGTTPTVIEGLPNGKYKLKENVAPQGYYINKEINVETIVFFELEDGVVKASSSTSNVVYSAEFSTEKNRNIIKLVNDAKIPVPTEAELEIKKTYEGNLAGLSADEKTAVLNATKFGVYSNKGCTEKAYTANEGSVVADGTENVFKFTAKELNLNVVGASKVLYVKETQSADGYAASTDVYAVKFTLEMSGSEYAIKVEYAQVNGDADLTYVETIPTVNNIKVENIEFYKVSVDSSETKISGATFSLYNNEACTGTALDTVASTTDGKVVFEKLTSGIYYIKETSTPENYMPNNKVYKVTINTSAANATDRVKYGEGFVTNSSGTGPVYVTNTPIREYVFSKVQANVAGPEIPGAQITLKPTSNNSTPIDMSGVEQVSGPTAAISSDKITWTSGPASGTDTTPVPVVLKGLLPGEYVMHEDAAPSGYLVQTDITFVVGEDGKVSATGLDSKVGSAAWDETVSRNVIKMVDDAIISDYIEIEKQYEGSTVPYSSALLANTEFSIYNDAACTNVIQAGIKPQYINNKNIVRYNVDGKAFSKDSEGNYKLTYYIKETKAPEKFVVDNKIYKCELEVDTDPASATYCHIKKTYSVVGESGSSATVPVVNNVKLPDAPANKSVVDISKIALKIEGPELEGATLVLSADERKSGTTVDFSEANTGITTAGGGTNVVRTATSITWTSGLSPERIIGLPDGFYQLEETVAPAGYAKSKNSSDATVRTIIYFAIANNKLVETGDDKPTSTSAVFEFSAEIPTGEETGVIKLVDDALKTRVKLSKMTNGHIEIPGAKMKLVCTDSTVDLTQVYRLTGAKDFVATSSALTWTTTDVMIVLSNLPDKEYILSEVEPPEGYLPADDIKFTTYDGQIITINGKPVSENDLDMVDLSDPNFVEITFTKADGVDHSITLQGAKFELFADSACKTSLGTATTDAKGIAKFENVDRLGKLYIKEIAAPEGYDFDPSTVYEIEVVRTTLTRVVLYQKNFAPKADGDEYPIIENDRITNPGAIAGIKYGQTGDDESTRSALKGAVIGLFKSDSVSATKANAYKYTTTKADGSFIFNNLPEGTYYVREISAPAGYSIDTTWTKCVVDAKHLNITGIKVIDKKTDGKGGDDPKNDPKKENKDDSKETSKKDSTSKNTSTPSKNNSSKPSGNGLMINPGIKTGDKGLLWFLDEK